MPFTTPTCLLGTLCVGKGRNTLPCVCPAIQIQMINDSFITGGALIRSLSYLRQVTKHFASQQNNGRGHAYFFQQLSLRRVECGVFYVTRNKMMFT